MKKQQCSAQQGNPANKLQKKADFSLRDLYVGIDVHKKNWQVAVYYQGLFLSNTSIEGNSEGLIAHLRRRYGDANFHCVYESSAWGFTLCRKLWVAGIDCMVVHAGDVPGTDKERRGKTDPVDARKLAMHLSAGLLKGIHVPAEKLQKQRSLIRFRKRLWGDLVRAKNRLKGELRFQGIDLPKQFDNSYWSHNFLTWIEQQANRDEDLKDTLLLMLEQVKLLRALLLKTEKRLRALTLTSDFKHHAELLCSIPGIGGLTAMLVLLEIGDVRRFNSADALNHFVGLCPDTYSSGEKGSYTGLTRRKHKALRSALVESSWLLLRKDAAMLGHFKQLQKRMKGQEAIIRIARKLLRRIRAVLLSETMYITGIEQVEIKAPIVVPVAKKNARKSCVSNIETI